MQETEFKKLTEEFSANIKGIQDRITDLEKAKLDKDLVDKEVTPAIEALKKKADELDIEQQKIRNMAQADTDEPKERALYKKWLRVGEKGLTADELKVLKISDDTTGGYLATEEVAPGILKSITEYSPIRSIASVRTVGKREYDIRTRTGVFTAQWVSEVGARNETTGLTFGIERLPMYELHARVDASRWDIEDVDYNLEQIINDEFGEQFGVAEGTAFVTGNTTVKPEGILTNANVGSANSGNATTIPDGDAFMTLYFSPKSGYIKNAKWLMRRSTMAVVAKLKNNDNDYLLRRLGESPVWTILGADVVECPDVPAVANAAYPVIFGDFKRGYQIVDRTGIQILRDPFTAANTGSVVFHAYKRVGGKVVLAEAIYKMLIST